MRLHDYLNFNARETPADEFACDGRRTVTNADAAAEANQIANAFVSAGIQVGDRVAILSKNSVEYAILYFGASAAGAVPVPLNYRLAPAEWSYIINDAGARMMIASQEFTTLIDTVRSELESVKQYYQIGGESDSGWESYVSWVSSQTTDSCDRRIQDDSDIYQMYTSGTTGHPKGAILQQRAVTSNIIQVVNSGLAFNPGERALIVAPMYHAAACIVSFSAISGGASLYIQEDFNPAEVVRAMDEEGIAVALLVPAMIQACLVGVPDISDRQYPHLRTVVYGASPIAADTLRSAIASFQCDFLQGFGMTETTAVISIMSARDHQVALDNRPELLLSAGRPIVGCEVRIVNEHDEEIPNGEIGEIITCGPQLMSGYWNLPHETASALKGGWMHTGDAGMVDDDGYIYIQDRLKDMIVSGGENVYPAVVEAALFGHPAVADVAVIGVPDDQWGETVKAIVVLRIGEFISEEDLIDFCGGKLGGFERPRSVDFIEALPRNASGKILKRELREPYWSGQDRQIS